MLEINFENLLDFDCTFVKTNGKVHLKFTCPQRKLLVSGHGIGGSSNVDRSCDCSYVIFGSVLKFKENIMFYILSFKGDNLYPGKDPNPLELMVWSFVHCSLSIVCPLFIILIYNFFKEIS